MVDNIDKQASTVTLSVVQMCSVPDVDKNIEKITRLLNNAKLSQSDINLVVLPECCLYFGGKESAQLTLAKEAAEQDHLMVALAEIAKQFGIYLVAGSVPVLVRQGANSDEKFTNTSCVFSPKGELIADYAKLHLFDVDVEDNEKCYRESRYTQAGKTTQLVRTSFANIGLTICYDLRFPELFRHLTAQGADIISVPSAFTRVTGKAHWQSLLQARAIENQVYIVAAGQEGVHENGRETWGHSMIISPWGEILTSLSTGEGVATAEFSLAELNRVRTNIPVARHNQFKVELKIYE